MMLLEGVGGVSEPWSVTQTCASVRKKTREFGEPLERWLALRAVTTAPMSLGFTKIEFPIRHPAVLHSPAHL